MRLIFIKPNLNGNPLLPDLGLAYIISTLVEDHSVKLLDMAFHTKNYPQYVFSSLKEFKPDVVGFSAVSFNFHYALKIASLIRTANPAIPLVYGGVHPTLLPEETLRHPLVDAVCIGEGEDTFKEYFQKLEAGQEPRGVAGIWYKDKSGTIIKNPLRPFKEDLDSIPFPNWDYWDVDKYLKLNESFIGGLRMFASRGCPYSCTFCVSPAIRTAVPGTFYRLRSPENIIEEIKSNLDKYYRKGFRHIRFGDDTFGLDLKHMEAFCSLYVKEGLSRYLTWSCQTRADIITEEWARLASNAGCVMVSLGIESGDEHVRMNVYNKKITDKQITNAVEALRKHNILYRMNMLLCGPEDSRVSIEKSLKLIKETKPVFSTFFLYRLLPKTPISDQLLENKDFKQAYQHQFDNPLTYTFAPRLRNTKYLKPSEIKNILLKIKVRKVCDFAMLGFKLKGIIFIVDILKQAIHFLKTNKPVFRTYTFTNLECNTTVRYLFNQSKTNKPLK